MEVKLLKKRITNNTSQIIWKLVQLVIIGCLVFKWSI